MPMKVGITGGIGSGKSTVCKVFRLLGAPVFEADIEGKKLLDTDGELKSRIIHLYGEEICNPDGNIDRKKLAGIIFNDEIQLAKVNALIHPAVEKEFQRWLQKQEATYIIHEAAILFESGFNKLMDFTILVTAREFQRIERVMKRDGLSAEQIRERMNQQWPDEKKQKLADVILNNDNKNLILPKIIEIDKRLKDYGKIW